MRTYVLLLPLAVAVGLALSATTAAAQGPAPPVAGDISLPAEHEEELHQLLLLTLPQQKARAKELIAAHPGTELSRILERLLNEYAVFDQVGEAERRDREARSAWIRDYWRSRCCPEPRWNPPLGRLSNATSEPVLYQIRLLGIERTLWMGPYRLRPTTSYESAAPYLIRYLTAAGMQEQLIAPGESYAFEGNPGDGTLSLGPAPLPAAPPTPIP